jgi:hypothetical protein
VKYSPEGVTQPDTPPNQLSREEREQNWRLVFDGETFDGWTGFQQSEIPRAWRVLDGTLTIPGFAGEHPSPHERGDIRTIAAFENFELRLQWALAPGGNSGIFYFVREGVADLIWKVAPEIQLLDDERHADGLHPTRRAGALYDLFEPKCNALKPSGEYNDARLVVRGAHVEHWLNGYQVVAYELDSEDWRERVTRSKFHGLKDFARVRRGHLALQDHGDEVRFRSIRIREG